ncbi:MAG: FHA domain-containing protein [Gemmatimonadaceae bacterium]|nr:FHA domain-containing protein [Gemmatimonadaceae bacterium]
MPYLKLQDTQHPLAAGETVIGAFDGAQIRLPSGDPSTSAVVLVGQQGVSIRRGTAGSVVTVNGVQLGVEPSPLLHGDRVEIAGHELRLGEDQKGGSTQFVSAAEIAKLAAASKPSSAPKKPTTATGGRLVSLVDGREYAVADSGMSFGREVGNDVVIASTEISRKHASIAPASNGYMLTDHSTNGVWVNGARVQGEQLLGRGDVIKMGAEEFRFYADVAKAAPQPAPSAAQLEVTMMGGPGFAPPKAPAPAPAPSPVPEPAPAPAPKPVPQLDITMMGHPGMVPPPKPAPAPAPAPAAAPAAGRQPLASLEIVAEGPLKGTKFELHSALTNIGRGDHNDIAIKDESISDSHAKIQKRADGWYVVDQESTNGTYVGGRRVQGEVRVEGAPDLRFGGIKMTFRPVATTQDAGGGTRAIAAVNVDAIKKQAASAKSQAASQAAAKAMAQAPEEKKKGCAAVILLLVSLAGTGVGLLSLLLLAGR